MSLQTTGEFVRARRRERVSAWLKRKLDVSPPSSPVATEPETYAHQLLPSPPSSPISAPTSPAPVVSLVAFESATNPSYEPIVAEPQPERAPPVCIDLTLLDDDDDVVDVGLEQVRKRQHRDLTKNVTRALDRALLLYEDHVLAESDRCLLRVIRLLASALTVPGLSTHVAATLLRDYDRESSYVVRVSAEDFFMETSTPTRFLALPSPRMTLTIVSRAHDQLAVDRSDDDVYEEELDSCDVTFVLDPTAYLDRSPDMPIKPQWKGIFSKDIEIDEDDCDRAQKTSDEIMAKHVLSKSLNRLKDKGPVDWNVLPAILGWL
jgi:hypothetical protein